MKVGDLVKKFKGDKDYGMVGLVIDLDNEITEFFTGCNPNGEIRRRQKVIVNAECGVRRWDARGVEVIG